MSADGLYRKKESHKQSCDSIQNVVVNSMYLGMHSWAFVVITVNNLKLSNNVVNETMFQRLFITKSKPMLT